MKPHLLLSGLFSLITAIIYFYSQILFPLYLEAVPLNRSISNQSFSNPFLKRNPGTSQKVKSDKQLYTYNYKFLDLKNKARDWKWTASKKDSDNMISRFGVPPSIFKPYLLKPDVIKKRKAQIKNGYFRQLGNMIIPDFARIVSDSRPIVSRLAARANKTVKTEKLKFRETIELILAFCQDIPYKAPPNKYKGKIISGLFPPPLSLNKGWADCDSKAVLFASIYRSISKSQVVLLESPGHISCGIRGIPGPYDQSVTYRGKKYIIAEPVGPGKVRLGRARSPYVRVSNFYPL